MELPVDTLLDNAILHIENSWILTLSTVAVIQINDSSSVDTNFDFPQVFNRSGCLLKTQNIDCSINKRTVISAFIFRNKVRVDIHLEKKKNNRLKLKRLAVFPRFEQNFSRNNL